MERVTKGLNIFVDGYIRQLCKTYPPQDIMVMIVHFYHKHHLDLFELIAWGDFYCRKQEEQHMLWKKEKEFMIQHLDNISFKLLHISKYQQVASSFKSIVTLPDAKENKHLLILMNGIDSFEINKELDLALKSFIQKSLPPYDHLLMFTHFKDRHKAHHKTWYRSIRRGCDYETTLECKQIIPLSTKESKDKTYYYGHEEDIYWYLHIEQRSDTFGELERIYHVFISPG